AVTRIDDTPVFPKTFMVFAIGGLIGLILPSVLIVIMHLLNTKVNHVGDVKGIIDAPIIGEINLHSKGEFIVVRDGSRDAVAEQFRLIRTNLRFLHRSGGNKLILVTSSMSGEGKTFLATNLSVSLALAGKRVAVVELDIRRPKMLAGMGMKKDVGVTNYLVDDQIALEEIIHPVPSIPNLFVVPAGAIPPNPAELLMSEKLG